jgi:hypothetical protein
MLLYKLQSISLFFTIINIAQTTSGCRRAAAPFLGLKMLYDSLSVRGANLCKVQMKLHSVLAL